MAVFWNGDPILYRRAGGGHGLVAGACHYRFAPSGTLQYLDELNDIVLKMILKTTHGDRAGLVYAANSQTPHQRQLRARQMAGAKKG